MTEHYLFVVYSLVNLVLWIYNGFVWRSKERELKRLYEMEYRFACVLDKATGGKMSMTNYTKEAMYDLIDQNFESMLNESFDDRNEAAQILLKKAKDLRTAQIKYMANRGDDALGKSVAEAAMALDQAIMGYQLSCGGNKEREA